MAMGHQMHKIAALQKIASGKKNASWAKKELAVFCKYAILIARG
jgi:hypothetical protein